MVVVRIGCVLEQEGDLSRGIGVIYIRLSTA